MLRVIKRTFGLGTNAANGGRAQRVLGIETSCDDTSASIVDSAGNILALVTRHQTQQHERAGGIVPSVAAIAHAKALPGVIRECLQHADMLVEQLDGVAATRGPGLAPCLGVGLTAGKNIAAAINKPLIGVHHMEAHALTPRLTEHRNKGHPMPTFPYLSLLVSGGHTLLIVTRGLSQHAILGSTLDDAVGEAFDKVARYLGLPWLPIGGGAGASLEQHALMATTERTARHDTQQSQLVFTVPLRNGRNRPGQTFSFSFSGLKTSVKTYIERHLQHTGATINQIDLGWRCDVAAAFQEAAVAHLGDRLDYALRHLLDDLQVPLSAVVLAGGVACNTILRERMQDISRKHNLTMLVPPVSLCTDNAAMIAWTGLERLEAGLMDSYEIDYMPKWPIDQMHSIS